MAITKERMEELNRAWNESDFMDDEEYREWYEDLSQEEQALIDTWDQQYNKGVLQISQDILASESKKQVLPYAGLNEEVI